jgi:hypothetical protein
MPVKNLYGLLKSIANPDGFDEFIIVDGNNPAASFTGEETMLINTNDDSGEVVKALKVKWFRGAKGDTGLSGSVAWGNLTVSGVGAALITATTTAAQRAVLGISSIGSNLITATTASAQRILLGLNVPSTHPYGSIINTVAQGNDIRFFPSGGIIMWSGSIINIPTGWYLCNGSNSTPDLRNKFVMGAGSTYIVGANGGSTTSSPAGAHAHAYSTVAGHQLTIAEMPSHHHDFQQYEFITNGERDNNGQAGENLQTWQTTDVGGNLAHAHDLSITDSGNHSHDTLNPYYALAFIMKS